MASTFQARLANLRMKDIHGVWRFPGELGTFYQSERERVGSQFFEVQPVQRKTTKKAKPKPKPPKYRKKASTP